MFQLVSASAEIVRHQQHLEECLHKLLPTVRRYVIGHLGMRREVRAYTNGDLWYTSGLAGEPEINRHSNALGRIVSEHPSDIIAEINIPFEGINRRVSGMFASDPRTDELCLLHRGGVGGGRKGIGRQAFLEWYRQYFPARLVKVNEGDGRTAEVILVACVDSEAFLTELDSFVRRVDDFKRWAVGGGSR